MGCCLCHHQKQSHIDHNRINAHLVELEEGFIPPVSQIKDNCIDEGRTPVPT